VEFDMQTTLPTPTILTLDEPSKAEARENYETGLQLLKDGSGLDELPDLVLIGYMMFIEAALYFASVELSRRRHLQPLTN
jgi:hypothetical protein